MLEPVLIALLLAQAPSGLGPPLPPLQVPHDQPYKVPIQPAQPQPQPQPQGTMPQNLKNWPKSCQRLHLENQKCELGYRTCNQRHIDYWRKKCEHAEPHGQ